MLLPLQRICQRASSGGGWLRIRPEIWNFDSLNMDLLSP